MKYNKVFDGRYFLTNVLYVIHVSPQIQKWTVFDICPLRHLWRDGLFAHRLLMSYLMFKNIWHAVLGESGLLLLREKRLTLSPIKVKTLIYSLCLFKKQNIFLGFFALYPPDGLGSL